MKFPVLWSGLCCYTEGWGGKCSEILATIKLLYNPRVNKVFTSIHKYSHDFCPGMFGEAARCSKLAVDQFYHQLLLFLGHF